MSSKFSMPRMPTRKVSTAPVTFRPRTRIPTGPTLYKAPAKTKVAFPGDPPAGFLQGELHGSASEWPIYAGLWKALGCKPDDRMRLAPFLGDTERKFIYQSWQLGGRSVADGAVADFEVPAGRGHASLLIRVQTYRFHLTFGPAVVSYDQEQKERLEGIANVIDAYESDFLHLQGPDLVIYIKGLLGMIPYVNPLTAGTVRRP